MNTIEVMKQAQQAPAIPAGWKLVPMQLDISMKHSADSVDLGDGEVGRIILSWEEYERLYAAMLAAAPQPPVAMTGWQPIETAPKDSKARLVYCQENKCIFCVSYDARDGSWIYFGGGGTMFHEPSHWMPLPQPPKEAT